LALACRRAAIHHRNVPSLRYLHFDVFTDRALEGNQLAVFPEPAGLATEDMQRVTREMNFSECTFIFPAERPGTDVRMRIFTPGQELPMAGHPTIGSTFALAHEGAIARGRREFVFGLGVGPTSVSMDWKGDVLDFAWMTQKNPEYGGTIADRDAFARALGLTAADLLPPPAGMVSCGVPFLFAPIVSRDAVDRVAVDRPAYAAVCARAGLQELPLFVFAVGAPDGADVYSRMLAPGLGVGEDPATGGASGPLGCYLHKHRLVPRERLSHVVSLQGVKMLRPSRIHVSIDAQGDGITRVRVGGRSVLAGHGVLTF
jgi:trans-2,3-dihydro-3-hydroxyanthranilate isomerase